MIGFVLDDAEVSQGHDLLACCVFADSLALLLLGQMVDDFSLDLEVILMSVDVVKKKL